MFWDFVGDTLGDYVFQDKSLIKSNGKVNIPKLNEFSSETHSNIA